MRNEGMARAIGQVDPDLIEEAGKAGKKSRGFSGGRLWGGLAAAAAALVLLTAGLLGTFRREVSVLLYGQELTSDPAALAMPMTAAAERSPLEMITVPLQVETEREVTAEAGTGTLEILREGSDEPESSGEKLSFSGKAELLWTVEQPQQGETYLLKIGDLEICLSYSAGDGSWTVIKR